MPTIPVEARQFLPGNPWYISNGRNEATFSIPKLLHAAITAGHGMGWRRGARNEVGGLSELLWKQHAFQSAVREAEIQKIYREATVRLVPTLRFARMDPSEKRGLTYHLGNTMATAWGREALNIPWWLHLDVYWDEVNATMPHGNSRPDLVGRHRDGRWVVIEAKGRSSHPSQDAEEKAKKQSQRITVIGDVVPALHLAAFSYFAADRSSYGREKPTTLHMRVLDPVGGNANEDELSLREMNDDMFFRLYYSSWFFLFERREVLRADNGILWRDLPDLDMSVGIVERLKQLIDDKAYSSIPVQFDTTNGMATGNEDDFQGWVGDGIILKPGDSWFRYWV